MRDINRIPEILAELEKKWMENPDYRLGQLITIATRPQTPHPSTFFIEDEEMLNGLKSIGAKKTASQDSRLPYWEKYPDITRIKPEEVTIELVKNILSVIGKEKKKMVITPVKLMEITGAPVSDEYWLSSQNSRIDRLRSILTKLKHEGIIEEIEIGYGLRE
jgi:Uma2 family endonuclease